MEYRGTTQPIMQQPYWRNLVKCFLNDFFLCHKIFLFALWWNTNTKTDNNKVDNTEVGDSEIGNVDVGNTRRYGTLAPAEGFGFGQWV